MEYATGRLGSARVSRAGWSAPRIEHACHVLDGCRGIELEPGDIGRALDEMKRAGAVLLKSSDL
jgi:hypothetical protein